MKKPAKFPPCQVAYCERCKEVQIAVKHEDRFCWRCRQAMACEATA